jgi:hypothetical protein
MSDIYLHLGTRLEMLFVLLYNSPVILCNSIAFMYLYRYVEVMGLEEPVDNIGTVLTKSAVNLGKTQRLRNVDGGSL